jgi:single-strand DNA-binding protein
MATATITLNGHIGRQATQRTTEGGKTVTTFPLASTPRIKKDGEWTDGETIWFTVSVWGSLPEMLFDKGVHVLVTGQLVQKTYTKDDGSENTSLFVNADTVAIVPAKNPAPANFEAPLDWEPVATPVQTSIETPF